ncbi:hypothetical protein OGAPHI_003489 [Ogataea philodendri]|uniref:Transcription elongation factor Spt6 n=1 Tax=Ogataea philodendri TaxID=1378263 RepID=A0A9P8P6L4_9ASCO|nr:uncharacterized protein OGAPHI_003489 [Ogataea philodendri]KAH3666493.1 hypothetical protein OGAPHI_003489 [Ogataea philodendri]
MSDHETNTATDNGSAVKSHEDFIEDTAETQAQDSENGGGSVVDSSEEDEDEEEDEEAIRQVRDGFIVDDAEGSEGDEDIDDDERKRRRKHKKRKREAIRKLEEDDELDEDDLELLRENAGELPPHLAEKSKFKRLKRGGNDSESAGPTSKGLTDMFSDEEGEDEEGGEGEGEEEDDLMEASKSLRQQRQQDMLGEFDDFIEDDEFSEDDEDRDERLARMRSARAKQATFASNSQFDQDKLDELYEIFGDGEEYAWALEAESLDEEPEMEDEVDEEADSARKPSKETQVLNKVFEFEELKEHLLTDRDQEIRVTDIPERFQAFRERISNYDLSDEDFKQKQDWVSKALVEEKKTFFQGKEDLIEPFTKAVAQIVYFVSKENLEVPSIWNNKKDYTLHTYREDGQLRVQKLLSENDLWRIVQLDIDFYAVLEKKINIEKQYKALDIVDTLYDEYIESAKTVVELQDLQDYLTFTYSSRQRELHPDDHKGKQKSHSKFTFFERIKSDPVYRVIEKIGIDAEKFGENVFTNNKIYLVDDVDQKVEDLIQDCVNDHSIFDSVEKASTAVKHMFSEQLFNNPKLKAHLRLAFQSFASVDIELTEKGKFKITDSSPYADFKYAINRPLESFTLQPDLFLRMLEAESLGLVRVKVALKNAFASFTDHLFTFISSDGTSDLSNSWNSLRKDCLDLALKKLIPTVVLDVKEKYRSICERLLFFEIREHFMDKVDQAPYHPLPTAKGTVPKVLAISNGDGKRDSAVIAVALDYDGSVSDHIKFEQNYRHGDFEKQLLEVINKFKPEVIAVSSYNVEISHLFRKIQDIIRLNNLTTEIDVDEEYEGDPIPLQVLYVPNETSRLYEHSDRALEEFSDKPQVARFCIGIARYVQSPLLEYMTLGDAVTSISIHKHQNLLSNDKVKEAVDSIFVDVACLVGIKINDAVRSPYLATMLQYISGLGPRKANSLIKGIEANGGSLLRRDELIVRELLTKVVFVNCAPFIELPVPDRPDKDIELLDATRIHPEDYELARKMASDALDLSEEEKQEVEQEEGGVISKLYDEGVEKLDDLLLEGYADQLEEHGHRKRATLEMIKEELQNNYEELRKSFHILNEDEVFELLTGETKDTFQRGQLVTVILQRVDNRFMLGVTQSGISCNISRSNILEYGDNTNLLTKYQTGQAVQAVIQNVDYGSFKAELSLLKGDIEQASHGKVVDKFQGLWDFDAENQDANKEQEREKKENSMKRVLKHPYFHNFTSKQAEDYLASKSNGEFVIRPSSKGNDHLTVTWKIENQLFQHLDVLELDKLNEYTVGRTLQVGEFRYHDLDELIVSHINNLHLKVQEITNHDKFKNEPLNDTKEWLIRYSKANKNRSCYCFCYNHKSPGWFYLLFKLNEKNDKIYTWNIKVQPNGYQLHGNLYPDMVHLCNGFKKLLQNQMSNSRSGYTSYGRF